ncbi:MAG TPA: LemA family protein [Candidatus Eisenbacteria bacterium]|nr:LemA family protein [Candidatus Eisenbacteria bacterium]
MVLTVVVLVGVTALLVTLYNRFIRLRNAAESAWSDIDVQLKRRWELVPNLIETVKGYAAHERTTFEEVTRARGAAMQASAPADKAQAEAALTTSLRSLFAVAERYPDLRASQGFLELQAELARLEDAIQNARRYYNAVVRDLHTAIETFPGNLVAGSFGIARRDYFELGSETERSAPRVSFAT